MKLLKKTIAAVSVAAMAISMCACGNSAPAASSTAAASSAAAGKTYTVGICQLVQHEALDAATEGFKGSSCCGIR